MGVNATRPEQRGSATLGEAPVRLTVAVALFAAATVLSDSSILWAAPTATEVAEPAPRAAQPSDRRRLFVGVVGLAALVFGITGLWLLRRQKARAQASPDPVPAAPAPLVTRVVAAARPPEAPAPADAVMLCPTCRAEYRAPARFCKFDGNRLVLGQSSEGRGPSGGVCPVCEQGFDPGITECPLHDEELVPAGAPHSAERPSGQYPKICPTCGVQYPNGSGFCGADGSALVTVN